jgi:hypothetical protein
VSLLKLRRSHIVCLWRHDLDDLSHGVLDTSLHVWRIAFTCKTVCRPRSLSHPCSRGGTPVLNVIPFYDLPSMIMRLNNSTVRISESHHGSNRSSSSRESLMFLSWYAPTVLSFDFLIRWRQGQRYVWPSLHSGGHNPGFILSWKAQAIHPRRTANSSRRPITLLPKSAHHRDTCRIRNTLLLCLWTSVPDTPPASSS